MNREIKTRIWKDWKQNIEKVKIEYGESRNKIWRNRKWNMEGQKTILCKIARMMMLLVIYNIYLILLVADVYFPIQHYTFFFVHG